MNKIILAINFILAISNCHFANAQNTSVEKKHIPLQIKNLLDWMLQAKKLPLHLPARWKKLRKSI